MHSLLMRKLYQQVVPGWRMAAALVLMAEARHTTAAGRALIGLQRAVPLGPKRRPSRFSCSALHSEGSTWRMFPRFLQLLGVALLFAWAVGAQDLSLMRDVLAQAPAKAEREFELRIEHGKVHRAGEVIRVQKGERVRRCASTSTGDRRCAVNSP